MTDPAVWIGGAALAGSVIVWLVRIEHRLTTLETTIIERLPRQVDRLGRPPRGNGE